MMLSMPQFMITALTVQTLIGKLRKQSIETIIFTK